MCTNARSSSTRERVVEVLRRLRVDREREPVAQVDPTLQVELRRRRTARSPAARPPRRAALRARPRSSSPARARARPARDRGPCARRRDRPGSPSVPLRSSSNGVPGTKYGSPTRSLPRDASSTTSGSDLEETADRQPEPAAPKRQPGAEHDQHVQPERPGVDVGRARQVDQRHEQRRARARAGSRPQPPRPARRAGPRS